MLLLANQRAPGLAALPRGARAPAPRRRTAAARPRAQRTAAPQPSDPPALQGALQGLEAAAVALAVGAHAAALVQAQRQAAAARTEAQVQQGRHVAHAAAAPAPAPPPAHPAAAGGWLEPGSLWLSLPLLAAVVLGRLRAWLSPDRWGLVVQAAA